MMQYLCLDIPMGDYMPWDAKIITDTLNEYAQFGWIVLTVHPLGNGARVYLQKETEWTIYSSSGDLGEDKYVTSDVGRRNKTIDWNDLSEWSSVPDVNTRPQDGMSYIDKHALDETVNKPRGFEFL